ANHYGVDKSQVLFGAGLDEMIVIISRTLVRAGDNIVTSAGTFGQYLHNAVVEDAETIQVPLVEGSFDLDGIAAAVNDKTAAIWICNPNNPTGTYHTHDDIVAFLEKVPSHIPVFMDEAYAEYVSAEDYPKTLELMKQYDNVALMRTFSKAYGLAGLRIGYLISTPELAAQLNVIRPPFNTTRLSEQAALKALEDQEYLQQVVETNRVEREKFFELETALKIYPSQTNFVFVETDRAEELDETLLRHGIIARLFPNGVRISLGFPEQNEVIRHVLKSF
ncbi:histidinol-phosphate transaminase, partial [Staphylococcus pseudintermedius]